jgi:hypothetical protein
MGGICEMKESIFCSKGGWTTVTTPSPAHVLEAAETRIRIAEHLDFFLTLGLASGDFGGYHSPVGKAVLFDIHGLCSLYLL